MSELTYTKELHAKYRDLANYHKEILENDYWDDSTVEVGAVLAFLSEIERLQWELARPTRTGICDVCLEKSVLRSDALIVENQRLTHELEEERRWIPVSERLPEYGEPSLTIYHTKNATSQITIRCLVEDRDDKLRVIWYDIENGLWVNGNNITHWMPLPEPPNADDYVGDSDHEHDDRIL